VGLRGTTVAVIGAVTINPTRIVPRGPAIDFSTHDRGSASFRRQSSLKVLRSRAPGWIPLLVNRKTAE
jgi:hypothetical protein